MKQERHREHKQAQLGARVAGLARRRHRQHQEEEGEARLQVKTELLPAAGDGPRSQPEEHHADGLDEHPRRQRK